MNDAVLTPAPAEERNEMGEVTGIELELPEVDSKQPEIGEPFDPDKIEVQTRQMTISLMISRIRHHAIDLEPDFQRRRGIWTDSRQSRLIESILLKIPLPTFYAAEDDQEGWAIVDGIQRLTAIARFIDHTIIEDSQLRLSGLEYLGEQFNNHTFEMLTPKMKRRLEETEIVVHVIRHGTPDLVKDNIFARINTGGIPLSAQELRHALIGGRARTLLKEWAKGPGFLAATAYGVSDDRMNDRELVLRFIAFRLTPYTYFRATDFDRFLGQAMREVNALSDEKLAQLKTAFEASMNTAHAIFGDDAFRKRYRPTDGRFPINKALYEAMAVGLAEMSAAEQQALIDHKDDVKNQFVQLMSSRDFDSAISQGTGDQAKVKLRFGLVEAMLREAINVK